MHLKNLVEKKIAFKFNQIESMEYHAFNVLKILKNLRLDVNDNILQSYILRIISSSNLKLKILQKNIYT